MMLDVIRASGGTALTGREERIAHWMREAFRLEGIAVCPESAVCLDCLEQLVQNGTIRAEEEVVVFNTGAAQKYPETVKLKLPELNKDQAIDYAGLTK
jgi:threonine synthase